MGIDSDKKDLAFTAFYRLDDGLRRFLRGEAGIVLLPFLEPYALVIAEIRCDGIVFLRLEGGNLQVAFHQNGQGGRLHAANA